MFTKKNHEGRTHQILACIYEDDIKTHNSYLELGAKYDQEDVYGKTALDYAIENNHINTAKLLMAYGAKATCKISKELEERVPCSIYYAIKKGDVEMFKYLLDETKISVNIKDSNKIPLVAHALYYEKEKIAKLLLKFNVVKRSSFLKTCIRRMKELNY
jgi:ankyrin repeat protein